MATDAGSRMHVLDWVERPGDEFPESLNDLLAPTGIRLGQSDHWRPLERHDPRELRLTRPDDPLVPVDLARHLRAWWLAVDHPLANDPNWDLAASATFPGNHRGLVLIERGMPELTAEAVVLRHESLFKDELVAAARARLEGVGVDVERLQP